MWLFVSSGHNVSTKFSVHGIIKRSICDRVVCKYRYTGLLENTICPWSSEAGALKKCLLKIALTTIAGGRISPSKGTIQTAMASMQKSHTCCQQPCQLP